ncbi:MAG TPA: TrmH family RNA methyltransferase [Spirochaetales bacterium]|nr:TrmH family RNA methyltransferase [Spirochaetales bacterium]HQK35016.1 TrmH family RNA methyltransferase [Spirochaetales bacterium]
MITVKKLFTLEPKHRYRKACQILELIEADFRNILDEYTARTIHNGHNGDRPHKLYNLDTRNLSLQKANSEQIYDWLKDFVLYASSDPALAELDTNKLFISSGAAFIKMITTPGTLNDAQEKNATPNSVKNTTAGREMHCAPNDTHNTNDASVIETTIRFVNTLRRSLESLFGRAPADWDFFAPLGTFSEHRRYFDGVRVFLEDIRSPYNVGSIFRTADACGFDEILLSGFTADPNHPRAQRTAMGACTIVPWQRVSLKELAAQESVIIGLELGGKSIDSFQFPRKGTLLLGSEELGLSPEARALCTELISIPMLGAKGSLNVSVAFGIVANTWRASLMRQGIELIITQ